MASNYPDDINLHLNSLNSPFKDDQDDFEEDELLCECGALLKSEDEIFSEECDKCFAEAVLEENKNIIN